MPHKKLTELTVQKLQSPSSGQVEYWDPTFKGFGLRVSYNGTKAWVVMTRLFGKQIRVTLGKYPALGLKAARETAGDVIEMAERGEDPRTLLKRNRDAPDNAVEAIARRFIEKYAIPKNRSWRESQRIFEREVFPHWGHRPIDTIARSDVNILLNNILDRGAPTTSNRVLAVVRKFFNWCVEEDLLSISPAYGVKPKAKENQRDRVLTDSELSAVWSACDDIGWPFGPLVKLLILTAQRRDEVARMEWKELDLGNATWTIPRERAKNDKANDVPLSPQAIEIIQSLPRRGDLVFTVTGETPVSGFPKAKRRLDEVSDITDWRLHDLRRTVASGMARSGVAPHIVEKVLNHSSGIISGVAAVYNRYGYMDEKREALAKWADLVASLAPPEILKQ